MVPKHKSSDAGNSDTPRRSINVLPLTEKANVLNKKKNYMLRFLRSMVRTNFLCEEEKKYMLVLLSHLRLQKLQAEHVVSA